MKANLSFFGLATMLAWTPACGGRAAEGPPAAPASGVTAPQPASNSGRALDESECRSLGRWLADACQNRPNERSARVDGWCSDILGGVESGAWVTGDCMKHIRYIDSTCFRSTTGVHELMACDEGVSRP
jgi:hypothetical protein